MLTHLVLLLAIWSPQEYSANVQSIELPETVNTFAISPDASHVVVVFGRRKVNVYDAEDFSTPVGSYTVPENAKEILFSPKGDKLLISATFGGVLIASFDAGQISKIRKIPEHKSRVTASAFSADGSLCVTGDSKKNISVWKTDTQEVVYRAELGLYGNAPDTLFVSASGKQVLSVDGAAICLVDMEKHKPIQRMKFESWGSAKATISNQGDLVSAWRPWKLTVRGTNTDFKNTMEMKERPEKVLFSPDGKNLFLSSRTKIRILDVENFDVLQTISVDGRHAPDRFSFSANGKLFGYATTWEKRITLCKQIAKESSTTSDEE